MQLNLSSDDNIVLPTSPRSVQGDLVDMQERKYKFQGYTQESLLQILRILKNALTAGQPYARILILHFPQHVSYTRRNLPGTYPLYNSLTLAPHKDTSLRVQGGLDLQKILEWLAKHHCTPLFANKHGNDSYFFLYAVFQPECQSTAFWNAQYMTKCLDDPDAWTRRCMAAIATGAPCCSIFIVYRHSDFSPSQAVGDIDEFFCDAPLQHLTRLPLGDRIHYKLENKFKILIDWVKMRQYDWTLCLDSAECDWAYFTILLDPIHQK